MEPTPFAIVVDRAEAVINSVSLPAAEQLDTKCLLDRLYTVRSGIDALQDEREKVVENALDAVRHILNIYDESLADLRLAAADAEEEIKRQTLLKGESIATEHLRAQWAKGRETWDGKMLSGFALAYPEINAAKKVGEPSVSIRVLKA